MEDFRAISGVKGEQVGRLLGALVLVRVDTSDCIGGSGVVERGSDDLAVHRSAGRCVELGQVSRGVVEDIKFVTVFA